MPSTLTHSIGYEFTCQEDLIAGIDEVGRGALFGVVVAAAVILPKATISDCAAWGIKDSKKLSASQRERLVPQIHQVAIAYHIGVATVAEIDERNILQASLVAMQRAILGLETIPELCLVDGNRAIPNLNIPQQTLVKGEDRAVSIAAASILAKVWRDRAISELAAYYIRCTTLPIIKATVQPSIWSAIDRDMGLPANIVSHLVPVVIPANKYKQARSLNFPDRFTV